MLKQKINLINSYRERVRAANKELPKKEAFKDLLNRLYSGNKEIECIIDKITSGSESTVLNIPRKDKLHKGSADTLYNKIIIEFENNLKVTLKHAKEQLAGYLLGQYNSGEGYNFTLIVTDCIHWKVFAPDVSQLEQLHNLKEDELILNEIESATIVLTEHNAEDFYYWIDRFLFKEQPQRATLKRIEESFGYQSNVFIESYLELTNYFVEVKKYGEVQVSYEQWNKFLSIAYGSYDANESNFLIHTYLSVFSKMLAYSFVSNKDYIDDDDLKGIINGNIFHRYNIQNFVDNDFFHWIGSDRNFKGLKKVFRIIAQELSAFDFNNVDEDILKGVYQELIDLDTRHSLGEYYTPDWLCERIVNEFEFNKTDRILDPACGSGSFLRAAIHRVKEINPTMTAGEINNNIYGIDIHPLSVQIAKTTVLLSLGKEITLLKSPVHLNIILANTLLAPEGLSHLFGDEFTLHIDKEKLLLNTQVLDDVNLFDEALDVCEDLAEQTTNKKKESKQSFENSLKLRYKNGGLNNTVIDNFYSIYESFKLVKEKGRDSIWKFIVQNLYKPYFLNNKFNFVIGNPPWFTFSSIKNEDYQNQLNNIAEKYNIKPRRIANFPHLEIAAIFLSYCSSYFLKETGKIAFVLPRSFFSADHHDNTRSGKAKGFRIKQIWDLTNVSPLFRIPASVFIGEKSDVSKTYATTKVLDGISFIGHLPAHNCNLKIAKPNLSEIRNKWYYIKRGESSAFSNIKAKIQRKLNPYKKDFKQGATIVPRVFYFIEIGMDYVKGWEKNFDWKNRIINVKTPVSLNANAKAPWKDHSFSGQIESNFIFCTAISKSILPFALYKPDLVGLPIIINKKAGDIKEIKLYSSDELMSEGFRFASRWFREKENIWDILKTEKNKEISASHYLNWQKKLTSQNLNSTYLVLYNASAKDANATVVKREDYDLEFIVESKGYAFNTNNLDEAYYLTAILNSTTPNLMIKDFQTKGLFGARDIHKRILDIYYPKFNGNNPIHLQLAKLSKNAHESVSEFLSGFNTEKNEVLNLGKIRLDIKKYLSKEMKIIDDLVKLIIK